MYSTQFIIPPSLFVSYTKGFFPERFHKFYLILPGNFSTLNKKEKRGGKIRYFFLLNIISAFQFLYIFQFVGSLASCHLDLGAAWAQHRDSIVSNISLLEYKELKKYKLKKEVLIRSYSSYG